MPLLPCHRAHDYRELTARWRALARTAGLRFNTLAEAGGERLHWLATGGAAQPAVYLSAGVHGDEAAAAWGLLVWAEENLDWLRGHPVLLLPCLNPHGLRLNTRADHRGLDLNRRFHLDEDEICGPWRRLIAARTFTLGLCLHEDYDAQGCYVYELHHGAASLSARLPALGVQALPVDTRTLIDGRRARSGIIRRRTAPADLPGLPEAIVLHQAGCPLTLTFETPSEFSLDRRVRAHVEFISAVLAARAGGAEGSPA